MTEALCVIVGFLGGVFLAGALFLNIEEGYKRDIRGLEALVASLKEEILEKSTHGSDASKTWIWRRTVN